MEIKYTLTMMEATSGTTNLVDKGERSKFDADRPGYFEAFAYVPTEEEAKEVAAKFPKMVKVRGGRLLGSEEFKGCLSLRLNFGADLVNKGVNETGLKRLKSFLKTVDKLGIKLTHNPHLLNSYPDGLAVLGIEIK